MTMMQFEWSKANIHGICQECVTRVTWQTTQS